MDRRNRVVYFDVLNIICCFSVVALHMNTASWAYSEEAYWRRALFVEVVCYFAVPVFLMLSGATLIGYRSKETTAVFLKKRFNKLLIPYAAWVTVYLIFYSITGDIKWGCGFENALLIINSYLAYATQPEFWFFQVILWIYLSMPLLSLLASEEQKGLRKYLILLGFISTMLLPMIVNDTPIQLGGHYDMFIVSGYLIYPLLGYELHTRQVKKKEVLIVSLSAIIAEAVRYFGTVYYSTMQGSLSQKFYGYETVYAFFPAVAVFMLCKIIPWNTIFSERVKILLKKISSCSFGVYLVHLIIMRVFAKMTGLDLLSPWYQTVGVLIVYVTCVAVIYAMKKIPLIKSFVP